MPGVFCLLYDTASENLPVTLLNHNLKNSPPSLEVQEDKDIIVVATGRILLQYLVSVFF